ncbi:MAG TPA: hypothetical protein VG847_15710 [Chitinophagaceae bacterium]|nr:hypothetical protein [Chitinophagaceae bacterium]
MTTTAIRKKLVKYVQGADEKKIKAIYAMVEDEINTAENDFDKDLLAELKRRSKSFSNGSAKTYSWSQTKKAALSKVKSKTK